LRFFCKTHFSQYDLIHSPRSADPMIVSQADALQAEASTKLKGILAAATAVLSSSVQAAATPADASSASASIIHPKKAPALTEDTSNKRPRDASDDRGTKKQTPADLGHPNPDFPPEVSANSSSLLQPAQITGNQVARSSFAPCSVLEANATGSGFPSISATKVTETSVSSLEGDRAEAEDIQAKYQAELAW
jgi:hypothetical protein